MSQFLPLLAARLINTPLLIEPGKAEIILTALQDRIMPGIGDSDARIAIEGQDIEASRFVGTYNPRRTSGQFVRASGRTALITIDGSLVNRGAWLDSRSGLTSYEGIGAQVDAAAGDPAIENIVLDINSPGGEATGMFALADKLRAARRKKKIVAVVNDLAASAGYGLAAQADTILISPTSIVGSIGVIMLHLDRSAALEKAGIKPTIIHAGAHKADGNPLEPLSTEVKADLQAQIDTFYRQFLSTVAAGRGGRLTVTGAKATEARIFIGRDAIAAGLADRVGTLADVLADLNRPAPKAPAKQKGRTMDSSYDEGIARSARAAERQRIGAIINSPEAKGRTDAAVRLACETDMSIEAARSMLATFPATSSAEAMTSLERRQAGRAEIGSSGLGANAGGISADEARTGWKKAVADAQGRRID